MKIGVVIGTNEPEIVWNAFRFGNVSLKTKHKVEVFLINKRVEIEDIKNEKYDVKGQAESFLKDGGQILACGTCIKARNKEASKVCPVSTMKDLLELIEKSDKILTFG